MIKQTLAHQLEFLRGMAKNLQAQIVHIERELGFGNAPDQPLYDAYVALATRAPGLSCADRVLLLLANGECWPRVVLCEKLRAFQYTQNTIDVAVMRMVHGGLLERVDRGRVRALPIGIAGAAGVHVEWDGRPVVS